MTTAARAYPWASLGVVSGADARASRAVRSALLGRDGGSGASGRDASAASALAELVGGRVEIRVNEVRATPRAACSDADVGVLIGSDRVRIDRAVLVEAEGALATKVVARALHRQAPAILAPDARVSSELAGAFAAVVLTVCRRVHAGDVPRVLSAGPAKALARDLADAAGEVFELKLTLLVDDEAYGARILVPRAVALAAPPPAWTKSTLASLGEMPLALSVVVGSAVSTALEVGTLRRGDAWLPGGLRVRRAPGGGIHGRVLLAAPSHDVGFLADLGEDGRIVLRAGIEPLSWTAERERRPPRPLAGDGLMAEADRDALVEAVGEVPVAVRVEIGVVEMRAREWASLGTGDVVGLGKKIGEGVTLRVGGVTVAHGELVDLDGEIGVRILGRTERR